MENKKNVENLLEQAKLLSNNKLSDDEDVLYIEQRILEAARDGEKSISHWAANMQDANVLASYFESKGFSISWSFTNIFTIDWI